MNKKVIEFQSTIHQTGAYTTPREKPSSLPTWIATPMFALRMLDFYAKACFEAETHPSEYADRYFPGSCFRVLRAVEQTGGKICIEGFDNIRKLGGQAAVITANHVSPIETYGIPIILSAWGRTTFVLKRQLRNYPLLGSVIRHIDPIAITRKNPIEDLRHVLQDGVRHLDAGHFVTIFPQGSRYRLFDKSQFNTLGTKLALKAKVPVVPICVATDFLRIGLKYRDLTATCHPESPLRFACGEPIPPTLPAAEVQRRQIDFITSTLARWEQFDGRKMIS